VQSFKIYAKTHAENLKQRQLRVQRYGQGMESAGSLKTINQQQNQYAMFSGPVSSSSGPLTSSANDSQGLTRRRHTNINNNTVKSPYVMDGKDAFQDDSQNLKLQRQQLMERNRVMAENRLSNTQRIETTISQVCLSLVMSLRGF